MYRAIIRDGRMIHEWSLADESGGIHISAVLSEYQGWKEWMGGAETHYANPPDYMSDKKPSHEHCWLLGKPCWHDGSSLYFSENIAPALPAPCSDHPHAMTEWHHADVVRELRYLHRLRFVDEAAA